MQFFNEKKDEGKTDKVNKMIIVTFVLLFLDSR